MFALPAKIMQHGRFNSKACDAMLMAAWHRKDTQIITWILASIDPQVMNKLHSFSTAKKMRDYLKHVYNQHNAAKLFQLVLNNANYLQGNLSIQDYYFEHSTILQLDVSHSPVLLLNKCMRSASEINFL